MSTTVNSISYYQEKALESSSQGQWQAAIECYRQIIALDSQNARAYHHWGDALINLEQYALAEAKYRSAIAIEPNFEWSYYNLAEALVQQSKWAEAVTVYRQVIELNPDLPLVYKKLAVALEQKAMANKQLLLWEYYQQIQQHPEEIRNYHQALALDPQNLTLYQGLAQALARQGQTDEALVAYQMAYQLLLSSAAGANIDLQTIGLSAQPTAAPSGLETAKKSLDKLNQIALDNLLLTGAKLKFPEVQQPQVSIILVLYNRAELTLSCLYSLLRNPFQSYELIIVDNHSTDATRSLLAQIEGANIILNDENRHFLLACNGASRVARGEYLLFLNNDAQILGDSITAAVNTISSGDDVGAVGGKIILPDGTLQEAGSIIWRDGSCLGYGRGDNPDAPQYMYRRAVDYCSGAFLLTRLQQFLDLGGFDTDFQPAYYEETDYCVRLQELGKKIIYDPDVVILHYEFASSASSSRAIELQRKHHQIFVDKHQDWLAGQLIPDTNNILQARTARDSRQRILLVEDRVPHPYMGSGYTRASSILKLMGELGYQVTLYPTDLSDKGDWQTIYSDINREVEVIQGWGLQKLEDFLRSRRDYYDIIFVSRPHNMQHINYILSRANLLSGAKIIYDAEALYCLRDFAKAHLEGKTLTPAQIKSAIATELSLAKHAGCILSVSPREQQQFIKFGYQQVEILGHCLAVNPTPHTYHQRQDLLFVGSVYELDSPNVDSILWLAAEIMPQIQAQADINLLVAGTNHVEELQQRVSQYQNDRIKMLGRVPDLSDLYNGARIFVVPTRYAAGIPHKVHEAAAYGIPVVTTSLIAQQLGWQAEEDLLVANTATEFAAATLRLYQDSQLWQKLRDNALNRIQQECSPQSFKATLKSVLC